MESTELTHYGVKGMKWGVRRAQKGTKWDAATARKKSRELNQKKKAYQQAESRLKNHINSRDPYFMSKKREKVNARDEARSDYKRAKKEFAENAPTRAKVERVARNGAKAVAGTLAKVGEAYVVDQMFFGGYGTTACKEALRTVGMATITAYTMARGGYDIKWYDKAGNRVG